MSPVQSSESSFCTNPFPTLVMWLIPKVYIHSLRKWKPFVIPRVTYLLWKIPAEFINSISTTLQAPEQERTLEMDIRSRQSVQQIKGATHVHVIVISFWLIFCYFWPGIRLPMALALFWLIECQIIQRNKLGMPLTQAPLSIVLLLFPDNLCIGSNLIGTPVLLPEVASALGTCISFKFLSAVSKPWATDTALAHVSSVSCSSFFWVSSSYNPQTNQSLSI